MKAFYEIIRYVVKEVWIGFRFMLDKGCDDAGYGS